MKREIAIKPIGIIHTPFKTSEGIPIQGAFGKKITGSVEVFKEYARGLQDIDGFSHLILIYYFHQMHTEELTGKPFLEDTVHGIYAIRSPRRPNHIGFSIVKVEQVKENVITFSEVDMLDGTPLLDIKPYISYFDCRPDVKNGWLTKHFKNGTIPARVKIQQKKSTQ